MKRERTPAERFLLLAGMIVAATIVLGFAAGLLALCVLLGGAGAGWTVGLLIPGDWVVLVGFVTGGLCFFALAGFVGFKVVRG